MTFPQYRKLPNHRNFYKITSNQRLLEIQVVGSKKINHTLEARTYFELQRIQDMLLLNTPYLIALQEEYESLTIM
ncbi:MAG: hypothetical protein EBS17_08485 [Flavobacteriia bacterium]|nr:hypothetical protein [Flavobacteriia bacterium]